MSEDTVCDIATDFFFLQDIINQMSELNLLWTEVQCEFLGETYHICPNYCTVRLGFFKITEQTCSKIST